MMEIVFTGLATATVRAIKASGIDAYGNPLERARSDGAGIPCRHCLRMTPAGEDYLILAHRPFAGHNPYAETGPIFLCADDCAPAAPGPDLPPILSSPSYLLRGYCSDERIVYGTGRVVATGDIGACARRLLARRDVAFVDIRSASNTCFQCRVRRA